MIQYLYILWNNHHYKWSYHPLSHIVTNVFFLQWELLRSTFLATSNGNTVLLILTIVTTLYITLHDLFNRQIVPLTLFTHFAQLPTPAPVIIGLFSNSRKERKKVKSLSCVGLFATSWTVGYQAPLSMGFSRQESWSGLPFSSPGDLPSQGIKPRSPAL